MVMDYFREKNIAFKEIDVSENREGAMEMVRKSQQMGVPVIDIRGNIVVGFNRKRIEELLAA